jgi:hypothetical protein
MILLSITANPFYWYRLSFRKNCHVVGAIAGGENMVDVQVTLGSAKGSGPFGGIVGSGFDNKKRSSTKYLQEHKNCTETIYDSINWSPYRSSSYIVNLGLTYVIKRSTDWLPVGVRESDKALQANSASQSSAYNAQRCHGSIYRQQRPRPLSSGIRRFFPGRSSTS